MTNEKRQALIAKLTPLIDAAMARDPDMRREAIVDGRTGLKEMPDEELEEFALDCWNVDAADLCDQCGAPSDDGEGEDGVCGNCADKRYNEAGVRVVAPE